MFVIRKSNYFNNFIKLSGGRSIFAANVPPAIVVTTKLLFNNNLYKNTNYSFLHLNAVNLTGFFLFIYL